MRAEFTTEDCKELGFDKTLLMCSSCEYLDDFGLEQIKYVSWSKLFDAHMKLIDRIFPETNVKNVVKKTIQHHYQNVTRKPS